MRVVTVTAVNAETWELGLVGFQIIHVQEYRRRNVEVDRQGPGRDQKLVEPWYRVVQPRPEVREGRSFNPDEFAIALGASCRGNRAAGLYESRRLLRAHLLH